MTPRGPSGHGRVPRARRHLPDQPGSPLPPPVLSATGPDLRALDRLDLPVDAVVDEVRAALAEPGPGRPAGRTGSGQDHGRAPAAPRRAVARGPADRRARAPPGGGPGRRPAHERPRRAVGGRPRGRPDPRRHQGRAATRIEVVTEGVLTRRLQHEPRARRCRPGRVRRVPRAEPGRRPGPGPRPRGPGRPPTRSAAVGHVGHARSRPGRPTPRW